MFEYGLAAAAMTAVYAALLPQTTLHSATIAAACLFVVLLAASCVSKGSATLHDVGHGGKLFATFILYQYLMKLSLRQSVMNLALINCNIVLLGLYQMHKMNDYSRIIELLSAAILFILVSFFLATLFPSPDDGDTPKERAREDHSGHV